MVSRGFGRGARGEGQIGITAPLGELCAVVTVRLLGAVTIERDGSVAPFEARKVAALLARLALRPGHAFSRAELAADLWPDSDDAGGRAALRTALGVLRQRLGDDTLTATRETIALRADAVACDVLALEECARRLLAATTAADAAEAEARLRDLARGPFLPGHYDDWSVQQRERLAERVDEALRRHTLQRRGAAKERPGPAALPTFASRFVGRERDAASLATLLTDPDVRLVTLLGPGGMGKTRLAVETARRLAERFDGAVWFVPLVGCADAAEILPAVARALAPDTTGGDPDETAARALAEIPRALIVLDNAEHLVDGGAASVVGSLLRRAPSATFLVTSRRVLGADGERTAALAGLGENEGDALFAEHARAVRPDFALGDDERAAVRSLCRQLDGIPLAIELCAAWAALLTPRQLIDRLDDRFALLRSRRRDIPERHRSLHAALESGCPDDPDLRAFFAALSVFAGRFDLESVEAVVGDSALERLAGLRERSLLVVEADSDTMRYRLLETVREFAAEKLEADAGIALRRRHLRHFALRAALRTARLLGDDAAEHFAALERDNPDFRAAIEFGLDDAPESLAHARTLIADLAWFWGIRGHAMPVRAWLARALVRKDDLPPTDRAWLLVDAAACLSPADAEPLCHEALALFEDAGIAVGVAKASEDLGHIQLERGDVAGMEISLRRAAEIRETVGDTRGAGYVLAGLAGNLASCGRIAAARTLWERCRTISRTLDDRGSLAVLDRAEAAVLLSTDPAEATVLLERALATFRRKGETWHILETLERLGDALTAAGQPERAADTRREADEIRRRYAATTPS